MHENTYENPNEKYQKIGVVVFSTGIALSALGETILIAILLKLPLTVIPKFILGDGVPLLPVFCVAFGNCMMLIEYQLFRRKKTHCKDVKKYEIWIN
ncbi:hypothetical protein QVH35_08315 [Candidatus Nitrosotenuis chungbukensis]|uniref:hypothetical protein n=1 Tax=Candidatus Nitrosotenuis chungbukensis TaxID=1353246 RepID=UPI0012FF1262|nr:hypothetical protein [Candidatus Nitrosotenuis chungbukensis]WKT57396.1 hypothetical protein QVH35_08315 [Candidatus Nitrosotenuis chungbukensis]